MDSVQVDGHAYRGTDGVKIKNSAEDIPAWNGTNELGWNGIPGGARAQGYRSPTAGNYFEESLVGYFWGRVENWTGGGIPYRALGGSSGIYRANRSPTAGFPIRCLEQ